MFQAILGKPVLSWIKMSLNNHTCLYNECSNTRSRNAALTFFKFPINDLGRLEEWKKNCGNVSVALADTVQLTGKLICENHFRPNDIDVNSVRKLLRKNSVPTPYLQEVKEEDISTGDYHEFPSTDYVESLSGAYVDASKYSEASSTSNYAAYDDDASDEVVSKQVCRLCLANNEATDITTEGFKIYDYDSIEEPNNIIDILKKYTHMEFTDNTVTTMAICAACHKMLQCIQLFGNMCRRAENCFNLMNEHEKFLDMKLVTQNDEIQEKTNALYNNLETKFCNILSIQVELNLSAQSKTLLPVESITAGSHDDFLICDVDIKMEIDEPAYIIRNDIIDSSIISTQEQKHKPRAKLKMASIILCHTCGSKCISYLFDKHQVECRSNLSHVRPVLTSEMYCVYCHCMFEDEHKMRLHVQAKHWNGTLLCEQCGLEISKIKINAHIAEHSGLFMCYMCGKQFNDRASRDKHIKPYKRVRRPRKKLKNCKQCNMPVQNLNEHKIKYHPKVKTWIKCGVCNIICSNLISLEKHRKSHEAIVKLCPICGLVFEHESLLKMHFLSHGIAKKYKCNLCNEEYGNYQTLLKHKGDHKTHACDLCDLKFFHQKQLGTHLELEHFQRFKCDICSKCFRMRHHLKRHVTMHTGIYPLKCHICDKGFSCVQSVNAHIRKIHNGGLRCNKCDKVFSTKVRLYKHRMKHA